MASSLQQLEFSNFLNIDAAEVLEHVRGWNLTKINENLMFYKISPNISPPTVTACVELYCQNSKIIVYQGAKRLSLKTLESKIGVTFGIVTTNEIRSLLQYLDSLEEDVDPFETVEENFNLNIVTKYPKLKTYCRFCFCEENNTACRLESITLDLIRAFRSLTNINLNDDSELPSKSCKACFTSILSAYATKELIVQSQQKLLEFHRLKQVGVVVKVEDTHSEEIFFEQANNISNRNVTQSMDINKPDSDFEGHESYNFEAYCEVASDDVVCQNIKFQTDSDDSEYLPTKPGRKKQKVTHNKKPIAEQLNDESNLCPECGESFYDHKGLQRHLQGVHDTVTTACEYCGKEYNAYKMKKHLLSHSSQWNSYQCEYCVKVLHSKFSFELHMRQFHKGKVCNIKFESSPTAAEQLNREKVRVKKPENKSIESVAFRNAIEDIQNGMTLKRAAAIHKVSYGSIYKHVKQNCEKYAIMPPRGGLLYDEEEEKLKEYVIKCAENGFPSDFINISNAAMFMLNENPRPRQNTSAPGLQFCKAFVKRHPELRAYTTLSHLISVSDLKASLEKWFNFIEHYLRTNGLIDLYNYRPENIFVLDETLVSGFKRTSEEKMTPKKKYQDAINKDRQIYSILVTINAAGNYLRPLVIIEGERVSAELTASRPNNIDFILSKESAITQESFLLYLQKNFLPGARSIVPEGHLFLFIDKCRDQVSMESVKFCKENGIHILGLYPSSEFMLQPLNSTAHPIKSAFNAEVKKIGALKKTNVCTIAGNVFNSNDFTEIIKHGFVTCGLYPLNKTVISENKLAQQSKQNEQNKVHGRKFTRVLPANMSNSLKFYYQTLYRQKSGNENE